VSIDDRSTRGASDGATWAALLIDVSGRDEPTKSLRLQAAVRHAIRTGGLRPGDRVPATRVLADDLSFARNVVVDAYDQLVSEGYLVASHGSGTRVSGRTGMPPHVDHGSAPTVPSPAGDTATIRIDLSPGLPDLVAFPVRAWRRCLSEALDALPAAELGYTDGRGAAELRTELARYLHRVRGAAVDPERLVITTGVSAALGLLARTLVADGRRVVAVEDPHAYNQRDALVTAGATTVPVPVDADGLRVDLLGDADAVVVAPAHQYPLGHVLSPQRRDALVAWARARPGRLVIEDDYDAEFRFDRRPIGSMQGLASDVVALTSSVSKTLSPALRLGWLSVPPTIADAVIERVRTEWTTPDTVAQHALAVLIGSGRYDRIIRARRRTYQQRRTAMVAALESVPNCEVVGAAGGLHLTVLLPAECDERVVSSAMAAHGICAPPLGEYRIAPGPPGLVMSFANIGRDDAAQVASALTLALGSA
jgi:GntR family transcriptional regulator / MocR family aminotransferase